MMYTMVHFGMQVKLTDRDKSLYRCCPGRVLQAFSGCPTKFFGFQSDHPMFDDEETHQIGIHRLPPCQSLVPRPYNLCRGLQQQTMLEYQHKKKCAIHKRKYDIPVSQPQARLQLHRSMAADQPQYNLGQHLEASLDLLQPLRLHLRLTPKVKETPHCIEKDRKSVV